MNHYLTCNKAFKTFLLLALFFSSLPFLSSQGTTTNIDGIYAKPTPSALENNSQKLNEFLDDFSANFPDAVAELAFPTANTAELLDIQFFTAPDDPTYYEIEAFLKASSLFEFIYMPEGELVLNGFEGNILNLENAALSSAFASPDCETPFVYNDPGALATPHVANMQLPCAWSLTQGSPDIIIGVSDFPVNDTHPDLLGKVISTNQNSSGGSNHGNAISGAAAGIINNNLCVTGAGFNSQLRTDNANQAGRTLASMMRLADLGVQVLTISVQDDRCRWEFDPQVRAMIRAVFQEIVDRGTTITFAVNNANARAMEDLPGAIMVGQADVNGNFVLYLTTLPCNIREEVLVDEAIDILVPVRNQYRLQAQDCSIGLGASSLAAPYVAGTVALMLDVNPCLTPPEIEEIITTHTNPVPNANNPLWAEELEGVGNLNAYQAVLAAQNYTGKELVVASGTTVTLDNVDQTYSSIRVETGGSLIINNSIIRMRQYGPDNTDEGRIQILRGAKLISSNSTFTKAVGRGPCQTSGLWNGIIVHGNIDKEQPNVFDASGNVDTNTPLASDDAGVLFLLDGSTIEYANFAISTQVPGFTFPEQVDRWGGLVIAMNSTFKNNVRGAHFTRYPRNSTYNFSNTSIFSGCHFSSDETARAFGITAWDTDDIRISNCTFSSLERESLSTIDGGFIVQNGNTFENYVNWDNHRHVSAVATYPYATNITIGSFQESVARNTFVSNNSRDEFIYSLGSDSQAGIQVINNDFNHTTRNGSRAMWIEGPSVYLVEGNSIDNTFTAAEITNTGVNQFSQTNLISCNEIIENYTPIRYLANNLGSEFRRNSFLGSPILNSPNVYIEGEVNVLQGNLLNAADNCFENSSTNDILLAANTPSFSYYITDAENCYDPSNPVGYVIKSAESAIDCTKEKEKRLVVNKGSLEVLQDAIIEAQVQLAEDPTNPNLIAELAKVTSQRDADLNLFIEGQFRSGKLTGALDILDKIGSPAAQFRKYGLLMSAGDFKQAEVVLNDIDRLGVEFSDFTQVQRINIRRYGETYKATASDLALLHEVGEKEGPYRSYARALLLLLEDKRYFDFEDAFDTDSPPIQLVSEQSKIDGANINLTARPNPANDKLTVSFELTNKQGEVVSLQLFDMSGRRVNLLIPEGRMGFGKHTLEVNLSQIPTGVYILILQTPEQNEAIKVVKS